MIPHGVKTKAQMGNLRRVDVSNDIRWQLIALARSRRSRTSLFSPARPTHWAPFEVRSPDSGEPFTPDGAWAFVCELLVGGCALEEIVLERPPGRKAYVILAEGWQGEKIYIKLQLGSGQVIGRSFHLRVRT